MSAVTRIKSSLKTLSPSEKRVAELLLDKPDAFIKWPVSEIAERAQVSKPTVIRLCRSVGYEGLSDLKLQLAAGLAQGVPFVHRSISPNDDTSHLAVKLIDNVISTLDGYRHTLNAGAMERAIEALVQTMEAGGRVEWYGVGNSGIVAQDGQHKFFRMGINTVAYADGHLQVMAATLLRKIDCAVIISNSGRSRDLLDAAELAKKNGATTIAITESGSPLASLVKIHLSADHPERYDHYTPMLSRLLHLLIIDILATGVALQRGPVLRNQLAQVKRNLQKKRYRD